MSIKDKIASILFGAKAKDEDTVEEPGTERRQLEDESPEAPSLAAEDPALIKLPGEHPLLQLYGLRRREAGPLPVSLKGWTPCPGSSSPVISSMPG